MVVVPHDAGLQIAFWLAFAGTAYGEYGRSVRLKRVVGPATLLLFGGVWLESCRRTADPPPALLVAAAAVFVVGGVRALRRVRFCARCGRTLPEGRRRRLCAECRDAARRGPA